MKSFTCKCGQPLFFDNLACLNCGAQIAYNPAARTLVALEPASDGLWTIAGEERDPSPQFRLCAHRTAPAACNWLVPAALPHAICLACRLTRTVPPLHRPKNADRLRELEAAKRRVLFALQLMKLPLIPKSDNAERGLAFDFLETLPDGPPVLTGHDEGVITLNVAEADDDYREKNRESLKEPYRTLVGHIRHEIGHYYWEILIRDTPWLPRYRELFGDDRADYGEALKKHYADGPPADWRDHFISAYAASHPWEDWAEILGALYAHKCDAGDGDELSPGHGQHAAAVDPVHGGRAVSEGNRWRLPRLDQQLGRSNGYSERDRPKHGPAGHLSVRSERSGRAKDPLRARRHQHPSG